MNKADEIYNLARFNGFTANVAKFVVSQAAHETNGFMSFIFIKNNNAFGMKYAGQSSAQGEKNGYAYYINLAQSVTDFAKWWSRHASSLINFNLLTLDLSQYVSFLKINNYFEDTAANYLRGCEYWYKKFYE